MESGSERCERTVAGFATSAAGASLAPRSADGTLRSEEGRCPHDVPDRAARRARRPARPHRCRVEPAVVPPPRREGPAKLTGAAMYADDLVVPGRLVRRDDPLDRRARPLHRARPGPGLRLVVGRARDRGGHPRREHRAARSRPTSRSSCRSAARSSTTPSRWRCSPRPDRATLRAARRAIRPRTEPLPAGLRPARLRPRLRHLRDRERRRRGRDGRRRPRPRGRVPGRPPGAAVHREQRDDRGPARRRRHRRHGLAPVPVLRPHRAQEGPRASTTRRRRSSRPRPAAGSAARRSSPRSSPSTPRSSRSRPSGRSG